MRTWAEEGFFLTRASHCYLGWGREGSKPTIHWLSNRPPGSDLLRFCSAVVGRSKSRGEVRLDSSRVSGRERAGNICGTNTNDSSRLLSVHQMFGLLSPPTLPTPGRISSFSPVRGDNPKDSSSRSMSSSLSRFWVIRSRLCISSRCDSFFLNARRLPRAPSVRNSRTELGELQPGTRFGKRRDGKPR